MASALRLKVFVTGRVAVETDAAVIDEAHLGGRQGRLVFAYLVAERSRAVPRDELAEALWGETPPVTRDKALTVIASKLRTALVDAGLDGRGLLTAAFGCYRLDLPEGTWVDLFAAASGAKDAEDALAAGDLERARAAAGSAESLARRPFLPGEEGTWVDEQRRELADLRERALDVLTHACLQSGATREAAKWAEELVALSPFREAGYRRLMEAHAAAGNRAEALQVYEQCRRLLADELGAYPSPETESIYRALLAAPQPSARATPPPVVELSLESGEPELSQVQTAQPRLRAQKVTERPSRKRRAVLFTALSGVIAAAVVIPLVAFGHGGRGGRPAVPAVGDSLGVFDARSGRLVAHIGVGATPTAVAVGDGAYWVANADGHTVSRVDPETNALLQTITVGNGPSGIATGAGFVWVVNSLDGTVSRIDPRTNTVVDKITVGGAPLGIVYAAGSVWVANTGDGTITRIDPERGARTEALPVAATELAFGAGTLWASQRAAGKVVRIDPKSGKQVGATSVGNGPTGIAFGHSAAWVANSLDGTVDRIDPDTNSVTAAVPTGNGPHSVAVDARGIWVSNQFDGNVVRIDPSTNQVVQSVSAGGRPSGLAMSGDAVLVAVRQPGAGHRGGTLVLRAERLKNGDVVESIDPALASATDTMPLLRLTGDGLVAFDQVSGLAGVQLAADLATSLPEPTDGGRTYTFRLRSGIRYSSGRLVKASDFRSTFERNYALKSPFTYDGIVGDAECRKHPKRCDLSRGIDANDVADTVTFHLIRPDPDFLAQLASPFAYVLPGGTPRRPAGRYPLTETGPYMIATYEPGRLLRFVRNPFFREWSRAAQPAGYPDRIDIRMAGTADEVIHDVVDGKADVARWAKPLTRKQASRLEIQYLSQLHTNPSPNVQALFLNTRVPPFSSLDARRAFNFAVDRAAAVDAQGGPTLAVPTCQVLPPNIPGYRPYCPYTAGSTKSGTWTAPDLTKAKALVVRSGTYGMKVTLWAWTQANAFNRVAKKALHSLGYRVAVKPVADMDRFYAAISDSRNRAQIGFAGWFSLAPADFLVPQFSCSAFRPRSPNSLNATEFCDPAIDRQMRRAQQLTDPTASRALWHRIDRELTDASPWVTLVVSKDVNFLSKRVGNYQWSPSMGMLIDQLWVR
jgi:YVTN family beta-propeller protein